MRQKELEEVIGPVMTVSSFKYQHDAVKHANNCPLGQAAYLFHSDLEKAARVASKIEASRICIIRTEFEEPAAVVAGMKNSGQGREGGDELLRFFSRESLITGH